MNPDLRYPIGQYEAKAYNEAQRDAWLIDIAQLPNLLEQAISNLNDDQLHTPYRPEGWTVHQLIHHIADSHMQAYSRMKFTVTEHNPTVKAYDEDSWLQFEDTKQLPVNLPLTLLHSLHRKMYTFLKNLSDKDWERTYVHSATQKQNNLFHLLGMYAWHGRHHTAHITALRERNNW